MTTAEFEKLLRAQGRRTAGAAVRAEAIVEASIDTRVHGRYHRGVPSPRPAFIVAWQRFADVNISVNAVGKRIGGKVQQNIDAGIFQNACPIRMSYVLNYCGITVPSGYGAVSGGDGKWYIFRVKEIMTFLDRRLGTADRTVAKPTPKHFAGMKGIIAVRGHGWSNAAGHVTLWNGGSCSDQCHLLHDPDNGTFVPETASLWALR